MSFRFLVWELLWLLVRVGKVGLWEVEGRELILDMSFWGCLSDF